MTKSKPLHSEFGEDAGRGATKVEVAAKRILDLLPGARMTRTRDVIQVDWRDDEGIVAVVTPEAIELRLPTVEWTHGTHGPSPSSRLWKRVMHSRLTEDGLRDLLEQAQLARHGEYATCRICGRRFPPEHTVEGEDVVCHGCAERDVGVVF